MTEMVQPLQKLIDIKKYKGSKKLIWTAFHFCRQAVSNCQELYFLEDTSTPILQTDASDYGIGGYLYMITNHQLRVVRFFSKALVGSQLNWSAREKECYFDLIHVPGKEKHQFVTTLSNPTKSTGFSVTNFPSEMLCPDYVLTMFLHHLQWPLR